MLFLLMGCLFEKQIKKSLFVLPLYRDFFKSVSVYQTGNFFQQSHHDVPKKKLMLNDLDLEIDPWKIMSIFNISYTPLTHSMVP